MLEAIFHGHSFVEIKTDEVCILIDPFITGNDKADITVEEAAARQPDAIIVTHGHDDHIGDTRELVKQTWAQVITSYELWKYFTNERKLEWVSMHGTWWWVDYGAFHVKLFQAWHGWWITSFTHGYTTVASWVIVTIGDYVVYHAWDTWLTKDMELLWEYYDIDVAFLPVGDRYTMWVTDAVIATKMIKPKYVVPIHYNTWPKIKADDIGFAREVMMSNMATPKILKPGQAVVLS